ncbi:MAG TPA: hypothetical protein PLH24_07380 [Candidatus Atribacteria bacterium]|jgi:hypothetical protein|nr:hypothetical protein [Atribacterota bacterium]MDY0134800.1 hypothetical protein [Atribacterota bacterium]HOA99745.1 hypothetical protein [Candidatus Atribacteria bacterium]HOQ51522.1 hypothetical protein [Candidatus Atribacteria bacterium]HPT64069.1 hypothetical protein [Candidatus Atribacteria bacterium]
MVRDKIDMHILQEKAVLSSIKLDHLASLSDHFGLLQHADYKLPKFEFGYTTDDNCRGLLVVSKFYSISPDPLAKKLAQRYLAFLRWVQKENGQFHNEVSIDRRFLDVVGSEDCQCRTFWALSATLNTAIPVDFKLVIREMLEKFLPTLFSYSSPRPVAFLIFGLKELSRQREITFPNLDIPSAVRTLAGRLVEQYERNASPQWAWFEDIMTWGNALLPGSLFVSYQLLGDKKLLEIARESFDFMSDHVFDHQLIFQPVGNRGWFPRGGEKAQFDQQPIEAMWMTITGEEAFEATAQPHYRCKARSAIEWFWGRNCHCLPLYDPEDGSCADGLTPDGLNPNRGVESTLSALHSLLLAKEKGILNNN